MANKHIKITNEAGDVLYPESRIEDVNGLSAELSDLGNRTELVFGNATQVIFQETSLPTSTEPGSRVITGIIPGDKMLQININGADTSRKVITILAGPTGGTVRLPYYALFAVDNNNFSEGSGKLIYDQTFTAINLNIIGSGTSWVLNSTLNEEFYYTIEVLYGPACLTGTLINK